MKIDLDNLRKAIDRQHHRVERFFDIKVAAEDKKLNLQMLERFENGTFNREDQEAALALIKSI